MFALANKQLSSWPSWLGRRSHTYTNDPACRNKPTERKSFRNPKIASSTLAEDIFFFAIVRRRRSRRPPPPPTGGGRGSGSAAAAASIDVDAIRTTLLAQRGNSFRFRTLLSCTANSASALCPLVQRRPSSKCGRASCIYSATHTSWSFPPPSSSSLAQSLIPSIPHSNIEPTTILHCSINTFDYSDISSASCSSYTIGDRFVAGKFKAALTLGSLCVCLSSS